jgi:anti-sigma regulatory factor (Ser/Thr protein kinase)
VAVPDWNVTVREVEQVASARKSLSEYLRRYGDGESDFYGAELILTELLSNALRYGEVLLTVEWQSDAARLCVHDRGEPFTPADPVRPPLASERGRGLFLVQQLAARLSYERGESGNIATALLPVRLGAGAL